MASAIAEKGPDDWQADEDLRTLARSEEIRNDPKRFKAAMAKAKEKIAALKSLESAAPGTKSGKAA